MELVIRVLFDVEPGSKADAAYVFAQTSDNQGRLFEPALELYKHGEIGKIVICGAESGNGYPGFQKWQSELVFLGAKKEDVVGLKMADGNLNTLSEAESSIGLAKKKRWKRVYAISTPFHQIRAFVTLVSILKKSHLALEVFNKSSAALPWNESALHSQGSLRDFRSELIHHEFDRIKRYNEQGDLVSCEEVFDYLNKRDANINE